MQSKDFTELYRIISIIPNIEGYRNSLEIDFYFCRFFKKFFLVIEIVIKLVQNFKIMYIVVQELTIECDEFIQMNFYV